MRARRTTPTGAAMTRVDFYLLPDADEIRRRKYLCRLVEKAWALGHRIWIHVPDADRARALDELLWTFRQGSFVPHERSDATDFDAACPVILGGNDADIAACDLLINEGEEVPPFFSRFPRVAEVVNQDDALRQLGRRRYVFYRDRGYELHHHQVS